MKTRYIVDVLLKTAGKKYIARSIPNYIDQNVAFIYSIKDVGHWKNCLCDGMGVWHQTGTEAKYISVEQSGDFTFVSEDKESDITMRVLRSKYIRKQH